MPATTLQGVQAHPTRIPVTSAGTERKKPLKKLAIALQKDIPLGSMYLTGLFLT
jgi:hypothetical protein